MKGNWSKEAEKERKRVVIRNIYEMMAYAYRSVGSVEHRMLETEFFNDGLDLLAAILDVGLRVRLRQGMSREYEPRMEAMHSVRGRVDMRQTMQSRRTRDLRVACRFDEYTVDTPRNRVIRMAVALMVRDRKVKDEHRMGLKRSMQVMGEIGQPDTNHIDWARLMAGVRGNDAMLLETCRLILTGGLPTESDGRWDVAVPDLDQRLSMLYEHFILRYFQRHHPEMNAAASEIKTGFDSARPSLLQKLQTDIILEQRKDNGTDRLVIDAKCYRRILGEHYGRSVINQANVNQIYRYVMHAAANPAAARTSGMLLYAQTADEHPEPEDWAETGHEFHFRVLNLGQPFEQIRAQLDNIAFEFLNGEI